MDTANRAWMEQALSPAFFAFLRSAGVMNTVNPQTGFLHWTVNGEHVGHLDKSHLPTLLPAFKDAGLPLEHTALGLELHTEANQQELSAALMSIAHRLRAFGLVPGWRNERTTGIGSMRQSHCPSGKGVVQNPGAEKSGNTRACRKTSMVRFGLGFVRKPNMKIPACWTIWQRVALPARKLWRKPCGGNWTKKPGWIQTVLPGSNH